MSLLETGERDWEEAEGLGHMSHKRRSRQSGDLMERSGTVGKRKRCEIRAGKERSAQKRWGETRAR